jgi:hypothetical protein
MMAHFFAYIFSKHAPFHLSGGSQEFNLTTNGTNNEPGWRQVIPCCQLAQLKWLKLG